MSAPSAQPLGSIALDVALVGFPYCILKIEVACESLNKAPKTMPRNSRPDPLPPCIRQYGVLLFADLAAAFWFTNSWAPAFGGTSASARANSVTSAAGSTD